MATPQKEYCPISQMSAENLWRATQKRATLQKECCSINQMSAANLRGLEGQCFL